MAIKIQFILVALSLLHHQQFLVALPQTKGPEKSCVIMLDESTEIKWIKSHEVCYTELGPVNTPHVDTSKLPEYPKLEEFFQYDDMCFAKCIYKNLEVLNDDGTVRKGGLGFALKSNMTELMLEEAIEYWDRCIEDASEVAMIKGSGADMCKTVLLHRFCFEGKLKDLFRNCK